MVVVSRVRPLKYQFIYQALSCDSSNTQRHHVCEYEEQKEKGSKSCSSYYPFSSPTVCKAEEFKKTKGCPSCGGSSY